MGAAAAAKDHFAGKQKKVQPHFGLQVFWQGHFPNVSISNMICDGCTAVMRAHYNDDETE